jgi:quercetin dioxygenase-like cupin family protein
MSEVGAVRVLDGGASCPELPIVEGSGVARAVVWPGVGAELRSMHRIQLASGARTVPLRHPMEAVYYVMNGSGTALDPDAATEQPLIEGSMVHIEPHTAYLFRAGPEGLEILGGPCPADVSMYARL